MDVNYIVIFLVVLENLHMVNYSIFDLGPIPKLDVCRMRRRSFVILGDFSQAGLRLAREIKRYMTKKMRCKRCAYNFGIGS